jgi:hypothetical protein
MRGTLDKLRAVIVPTHAVKRAPERTPAARNVRVVEDNTRYSPVPDPIRQSDWTGVGRDTGFSSRQIAVFFNIADIQAVAQDDFAYAPGTIAYEEPHPYIPRGSQTPQSGRINVQKPSNISYGSLLQLETVATPPYLGGTADLDRLMG